MLVSVLVSVDLIVIVLFVASGVIVTLLPATNLTVSFTPKVVDPALTFWLSLPSWVLVSVQGTFTDKYPYLSTATG